MTLQSVQTYEIALALPRRRGVSNKAMLDQRRRPKTHRIAVIPPHAEVEQLMALAVVSARERLLAAFVGAGKGLLVSVRTLMT